MQKWGLMVPTWASWKPASPSGLGAPGISLVLGAGGGRKKGGGDEEIPESPRRQTGGHRDPS